MEDLFTSVFSTWGMWGFVVLLAGWIIYKEITDRNHISKVTLDDLYKSLGEKSRLLEGMVDNVSERIEDVDTNLSERIESMDDKFDTKIELLEERIKTQPKEVIMEAKREKTARLNEHNKQMQDLITLGPKLHKVLNEAIMNVNCDHVFIGSFHNGTSTLTGIPYYKFDIIAEKFAPIKVEQDFEFARLYKDMDILRLDKLPELLINNKIIYFKINEDKSSKLSDVDNIIYRRMCDIDCKQLAVHVLFDSRGIPSGFVGGVRFDYEHIKLGALKECAYTLELLYRENENKNNNENAD